MIDARKRRLVSKSVALRHGRSYYKVSLWRYGAFFCLLISLLASGYMLEAKQKEQASASGALDNAILNNKGQLAIDEETSIGVALGLAEQADLPVARDVVILSEMNAIKKEISAQSAELTVAKVAPIFDLASTNRSIKIHTVQAGETVQQIADRYNISSTTLKWANGLKNDNIAVGANLRILPVDGIVYKVKDGDTIDAIADKYKSNAQRIQILNDIELKGLIVGEEIVIPEGILPNEDRPEYVPPAPPQITYSYSSNGSGGRVNIVRLPNNMRATSGNRYVPGNCTWYSFERRAQLGRPIGGLWGNATSWAYSAARAGFTVNKTPAPGAIFQTSAGWYGYGHVGIVEAVYENGDILVTEMNYGGYNVITQAVIKAEYVASYNYIH